MSAAIRSAGDIVLTVASSGIAALLIPGGRTAHSRFCIPLLINESSTCTIEPDSPLGKLIGKAKLIIWDEAPIMHRFCFEAVDRTFRDIMKEVDEKNKTIPFGGKVVVFGGDFRQILPVIPKANRQEVVHATLNSSHLWNYIEVLTLTKNMRLLNGASDVDIDERRLFSEWVLGIGDGRIGEDNELDKTVIIPPDLLIPSSGDPIESIVDNTYPNLLHNMDDISSVTPIFDYLII